MERKCSSIYSMGVFSYLFFSSPVLVHLFRKETWTCKQRRACTGTLLSASGRAGQGSHRTLQSAPAPKHHVGDGHGTVARGETGRALEGPGELEGQLYMRWLMLWSSRDLQVQCALPLRLRILPSVWLALTVPLKFHYLQFAAGFKIKPCYFKLYTDARWGRSYTIESIFFWVKCKNI